MQRKTQKYWYRISVDTLRLWSLLAVLAVAGAAAFWGYGHLKMYLLERRVERGLAEGRELAERLRPEPGLEDFRAEYATGRRNLDDGQRLLEADRIPEAFDQVERGRTLLASIRIALRNRSAAGAAQFISVHGGVEFRRGERGPWQTARGRVSLLPGDYVKTSGGGSAEIMTLEGTLFTVRPDTVILIDHGGWGGGAGRERTIALETGWVDLSTSRAASRITTPQAEARVERRSEASVSYEEAKQVGRFTAFRGDMEVTASSGGSQRLEERQQMEQRAGRLSQVATLPEAPTALEPRDNLELDLEENDRLVLAWQPVRGATGYSLQVSRSRLFVDNIIDVERRKTSRATLGLRGEGSFVWRVAASDAAGRRGPWSLPRRFRVSKAVDEPSAARPEAAAPGAGRGS